MLQGSNHSLGESPHDPITSGNIITHFSRGGLYGSSDVFDPIRLTIKIKPSQHYKIHLNHC